MTRRRCAHPRQAGRLPENLERGEIWPLPSGGASRELVAAARSIGSDFCFFDHWPGAVAEAKACGLASGAVVNGPWQRWMSGIGWEAAMKQMGRSGEPVDEALLEYAAKAGKEMLDWAAIGVDMILLADDVAYSGGPYMPPPWLEQHLAPLYAQLAGLGAAAGAPVGFHSDGCVDLLLPTLRGAGFRFYSLEPEGTHPIRAWELLQESLPLFSGLPAAWLMPDGFSPATEGRILRQWREAGPLVVSSACGLYHEAAPESLRRIYAWLDSVEGRRTVP